MKSRRKHGFQFMTILYFLIVFCMCVSRFNVIMTIMGGQLTRVEEMNLLPFHSIRENLKYGHSPVSWDMLYNMVMFVPFGVIYCYYQKNFRVYKAVGMSCLTTFFIESAQLVLKTGVVDIDDLIVNTLGSLTGIVVYVILQQISFKNQKFEIHELIDISATMLPPMFVAFIAEMFLGDGSLKLLPVHCVVLLCYGIFVYVFLIRDFTRKAKVYYLACYVVGNADAVPQPPERCLSRKAGIVRCCPKALCLTSCLCLRNIRHFLCFQIHLKYFRLYATTPCLTL